MNKDRQRELDGKLIKVLMTKKCTCKQIKDLIDRGAYVDACNDNGITPLMYASKLGMSDIVSILLQSGADVNHKNSEGNTSLIIAALYGSPECVRLLLDAGADVCVRDNCGWTALMYAAGGCNIDCMKLIIEYGADIFAQNNQGENMEDIIKHRYRRVYKQYIEGLKELAFAKRQLRKEDFGTASGNIPDYDI